MPLTVAGRLRPVLLTVLSYFVDAVPKKRGPKTDVLEALLKRVDGLEAKLKEKNSDTKSPTTPTAPQAPTSSNAPTGSDEAPSSSDSGTAADPDPDPKVKRLAVDSDRRVELDEAALYSPNLTA